MSALRIIGVLLAASALAGCAPPERPGIQGDPVRGKVALTQYACQSCHMITAVPGSKVYVGRPLLDYSKQKVLAGNLENNQANMVRWIRDPQSIDPHTAMPNMGVTERDALDMSAYLLLQ